MITEKPAFIDSSLLTSPETGKNSASGLAF